jgi:DNA-binding CsgD family transcriptional regulator
LSDTLVLDIVDRIYAASLNRFEWPDTLERIADLIGARTALLMAPAHDDRGWRIVTASRLAGELVDAYNSQWGRDDPFLGAAATAGADALTVQPLSANAARSTAFGRFFCEPAGFEEGLVALSPAKDHAALQFWRAGPEPFGPPEVSRIRTLWPHVSRALSIQAACWPQRTDVRPAAWAESVLDFWHVAVIGFTASGRQVYANRAARRLASRNDGLAFAVDGPVASSVAQTRQLRDAIHQLAQGAHSGPTWLRLRRPSGAASYELGLIRLAPFDREGTAVAMLAAAPDEPIVCDRTALHCLHGLTNLESSIAQGIVNAIPIADIGETLDLSVQTTRWYVQQVREKIDAASQRHLLSRLVRGLTVIEWPVIPTEDSDKPQN